VTRLSTSASPSLAEHVLEVVPSVVYVLDLQTGENLFANRSIGDALGYAPDEIQALGKDIIQQLLHPDDLEGYVAHVRNLRSLEDGDNLEFEYRMRHRVTGEWCWLLSRDAVFKRRDGEVWQIIGSATDITERKRAERALTESEARYRTLFNSIDEGFCLCEMILDDAGKPVDYRFLDVNPMFESQTGLIRPVGKTALELVPNLEPHWFETYGRVALTGESARFVDGSEAMGRWFDVYAFRFGDAASRQFAVLFKDITERKRADTELRASEERYRMLAESQKRFVADAGHELRAPLTSILGNLQLLNRFPDMPPEDRQQSLSEAAREAARLTRLVNDLLALARGDARTRISHELVALHDLLRAAWREFSAHGNAHLLPPPTLEPVTVMGDADKLLQLAIILLENAVKYTPDGGMVRLSLTRQEQHATLIVTDTGIGIAETDLPHVFERFYRADKARVHGRDPGGTGLGLPIAQWIAQVHGGSIHLESELGRGTTVTVRLPMTPAPS
jgi:PAS domain S-box-containing protein